MPRRSKGARLWLRPARRKKGKIVANAVWIIIDGRQHIATGCLAHEADTAERRLADYIARKYQPARHARDIETIDIADVLSIYLDDCGSESLIACDSNVTSVASMTIGAVRCCRQ